MNWLVFCQNTANLILGHLWVFFGPPDPSGRFSKNWVMLFFLLNDFQKNLWDNFEILHCKQADRLTNRQVDGGTDGWTGQMDILRLLLAGVFETEKEMEIQHLPWVTIPGMDRRYQKHENIIYIYIYIYIFIHWAQGCLRITLQPLIE